MRKFFNLEKKNPNNRIRTGDRLISAFWFILYSQALYQLSYVRKVTFLRSMFTNNQIEYFVLPIYNTTHLSLDVKSITA